MSHLTIQPPPGSESPAADFLLPEADLIRFSLPLADLIRCKDLGPHKFSSTQFNLEEAGYSRSQGSPVEKIKAMAVKIPDTQLAGDGREKEVHVTVKYGLHTADPEEVRRVVEGFGAVNVRLGKTSVSPAKEASAQRGDEQYDVVKIDVAGDDIFHLNRLLCDSLEHTDTHLEYKPHVTLAYVKSGCGKQCVGWADVDGYELRCHGLVFSDPEGKRTVISLSGSLSADSIRAKRLSSQEFADRLEWEHAVKEQQEHQTKSAGSLIGDTRRWLDGDRMQWPHAVLAEIDRMRTGPAADLQQVWTAIVKSPPPRTRGALADELKAWLTNIAISANQSSFRLKGDGKTLSALNETSGGALVPPAKVQRPVNYGKFIGLLRNKFAGLFQNKGWVTVGGHKEGEEEHVGGTPVEIEGGEVRKGPANLVGSKLQSEEEQPKPVEKPTPKRTGLDEVEVKRVRSELSKVKGDRVPSPLRKDRKGFLALGDTAVGQRRGNTVQLGPSPEDVESAKVFRVKISDVYQGQQHANSKEGIMRAAEGRGMAGNEPVTAVEHRGKIYLIDGHHRIAAHLLAGRESIDAKLIRLNDEGDVIRQETAENLRHKYKS